MTPFIEATAELGKHAAAEIDREYHNIETARKNLDENIAKLKERTDHFITNGWADLRQRPWLPLQVHSTGWGKKGWRWSQYFRQLAKSMKRPFVHVYEGGFYNYQTREWRGNPVLCIPKRKYLNVLSAQFWLLDIRTSHNTVEWQWSLTPEQFDAWVEFARTDKDARKALKLP